MSLINPDIYCMTIVIRVVFLSKSKYKPSEIRYVTYEDIPVLAVDKDIPERERNRLYQKTFDEKIHKGDFSKYNFSIVEIKKSKFLSKICYQYTF